MDADAVLDEEKRKQIVLKYLKNRGYNQSVESFAKEARFSVQTPQDKCFSEQIAQDSYVNQTILNYNIADVRPEKYEEYYRTLPDWAYNSLDIFKAELCAILYPIYVHFFLELIDKEHTEFATDFFQRNRIDHEHKHLDEIQRLSYIKTRQHLAENALAQTFLKNKMDIRLSSYAFELLISFVYDARFMLVIKVINFRLNIKIYEQDNLNVPNEEPVAMITGLDIESDKDALEHMNKSEIGWGALPEVSDQPNDERPDPDAPECYS